MGFEQDSKRVIYSVESDKDRINTSDRKMDTDSDQASYNAFLGLRDIGQAEAILTRYRKEFPSDYVGAEQLLSRLIEALEDSDEIIGEADDFHNFSVHISKLANDNQEALMIVKHGLFVHPYNTDLLADAIKYGYSCGKKAECQKWFDTLESIDYRKWTWRSFSFVLEYLLEEWKSTSDYTHSISGILGLVKKYQELLPDEEDAWYSEFEIYYGTNQRDKGIAVLEKAINKFKYCPRCWLRYADIMLDQGEYAKAKPVIAKMRRNPKTREKINAAYMFLLDAQCKLYEFQSTEDYENGVYNEKVILQIYRTFRKALLSSDLTESIKKQISEYINEIYGETGIEYMYPEDLR